jgi:hypothetical protein
MQVLDALLDDWPSAEIAALHGLCSLSSDFPIDPVLRIGAIQGDHNGDIRHGADEVDRLALLSEAQEKERWAPRITRVPLDDFRLV